MSEKMKNRVIVVVSIVLVYGFLLWGIFQKDGSLSVSERRKLTQFPKLSVETVLSGEFMEKFDKYTLDQFPLRDLFRRVKAYTSFYVLRQKDNHDIYLQDGHAIKMEYPLNEKSIEHAADRFSYVYDKLLAGKVNNVYVSLIPDKNYFAAADAGYLSLNYDDFVGKLTDRMPYAEYLDLFPVLSLEDYYATDTHWRQEKLRQTAVFLAQEMGVTLSDSYTVKKAEVPFYGVYYGQSALPLPAEDIFYLEADWMQDCIVTDYETDRQMPIYTLEKLQGNDPYELFLGGPKSLISIENPNATTDKELIVFRDSFGSSLMPLLAEGYRKITLADIRYIQPDILAGFLQCEGSDALFLYSTSVINHSETIK